MHCSTAAMTDHALCFNRCGGVPLNVQGPKTISQQTRSGLYSQYYKYLTETRFLTK